MNQIPSSDTQGLGKAMIIAAWILGLLLLTLFFNHWSQLKKISNQTEIISNNGNKQTILKRNENNQYVAKGFINKKAAIFLLDTGATDVVIPSNVAKQLNLTQGLQGVATTAGGNIYVYETHIEELIIGNIVLHNIIASINPHMSGEDILLGMSALKKIAFFQEDDTLILMQRTNASTPN